MVVKLIDRPAILGDDPAFTDPLPFNRPTLPPFRELADDFRDIIDTGLLTNGSRVATVLLSNRKGHGHSDN